MSLSWSGRRAADTNAHLIASTVSCLIQRRMPKLSAEVNSRPWWTREAGGGSTEGEVAFSQENAEELVFNLKYRGIVMSFSNSSPVSFLHLCETQKSRPAQGSIYNFNTVDYTIIGKGRLILFRHIFFPSHKIVKIIGKGGWGRPGIRRMFPDSMDIIPWDSRCVVNVWHGFGNGRAS